MVHVTITFIPADGVGMQVHEIKDFDLVGQTGLTLRHLVAQVFNVPSGHLQLFCSGKAIEDADNLIEKDFPKNVKILASVSIPSTFKDLSTSSPTSTNSSTPTPGPDAFVTSPTSTNRGTFSGIFSPAPVDLSRTSPAEYLQKMLSMAHAKGTSWSEAAKEAPSEGPTAGLMDGFVALIGSAVPAMHLTGSLGNMTLPNPLEGLKMDQAVVAGFDLEACDYAPLMAIKTTFEALPLAAKTNKDFAIEAGRMFQALYDVLNGTKNKSIFTNATSIEQRIANPTFVRQYTLQSEHPIATNQAIVAIWDALVEAKVMMESAREAISREVYTDEVRLQLNNVIELASGVETQINHLMGKLEELRTQYQDFPSVESLKEAELTNLKEISDTYQRLLTDLQQTAMALDRNTHELQAQHTKHKEELQHKMASSRQEVSRLSAEQNLLLHTMDILGRMYLEHETERRKQLHLLDLYTTKANSLEAEKVSYMSEASRHAERVSAATKDTTAALSALNILNKSVHTQMGLLQQWSDEAKSQHTELGVRTLTEAHRTAHVKFLALVEIWDSAKRSIEDIQPELVRLNQEILTASQVRSPVRVESATRAKKDLDAQLPIFEQRRDEAETQLSHLEKSVFPAINEHLKLYGKAPFEIPARTL